MISTIHTFELDIIPNGKLSAYERTTSKDKAKVIQSRRVLQVVEGPAYCQNQIIPRIARILRDFMKDTGHDLSAMNPYLRYDIKLVQPLYNPKTRLYEYLPAPSKNYINFQARINKVMGKYREVASPMASPFFVRLVIDSLRLTKAPTYKRNAHISPLLSHINENSKRGIKLNPSLSEAWALNSDSSFVYAAHKTGPLKAHLRNPAYTISTKVEKMFPPIANK